MFFPITKLIHQHGTLLNSIKHYTVVLTSFLYFFFFVFYIFLHIEYTILYPLILPKSIKIHTFDRNIVLGFYGARVELKY